MSLAITTRPARKADASDIAMLVNIAVHGGIGRMWGAEAAEKGAYDAIEIGRLQMLHDDTEFGWRSATMAEVDGEVAGMLLGYRKPDAFEPVPDSVTGFMRPIEELEAEAAGHWFISMLGAHFNWRGKGIGSALLAFADKKRAETAASGVALIVEDANEGARRLYSRQGFAVRDRRKMVKMPGSGAEGEDWLLMVKE